MPAKLKLTYALVEQIVGLTKPDEILAKLA